MRRTVAVLCLVTVLVAACGPSAVVDSPPGSPIPTSAPVVTARPDTAAPSVAPATPVPTPELSDLARHIRNTIRAARSQSDQIVAGARGEALLANFQRLRALLSAEEQWSLAQEPSAGEGVVRQYGETVARLLPHLDRIIDAYPEELTDDTAFKAGQEIAALFALEGQLAGVVGEDITIAPPPPTVRPLRPEEAKLAQYLPAALARSCMSTPVERFDALEAVTCSVRDVTVELYSAPEDGSYLVATGYWLEDCNSAGPESLGVGGTLVGDVDGCEGSPSRLMWFVPDLDVLGIVSLDGGTLAEASDWFVKNRPFGDQDGPVYGTGESPVLPSRSFAQLAGSAARPDYTKMLRSIETYEGRLVRFRGRVSIVDGDDVYVDVTPIGYGLYEDTIILDSSNVPGRIISDDIIDFVGFVTGTEDYFLGDVPGVDIVAYVIR
jgi:hypothetical protein